MGAEKGDPAPGDVAGEDGIADSSEGPRPGKDEAATCIARRLLIDPGRGLLIDVPGARATTMFGEKIVDAGLAGVRFGIDTGRGVLTGIIAGKPGDEAAEAPPQPEA